MFLLFTKLPFAQKNIEHILEISYMNQARNLMQLGASDVRRARIHWRHAVSLQHNKFILLFTLRFFQAHNIKLAFNRIYSHLIDNQYV